jgi:hypothetical protein
MNASQIVSSYENLVASKVSPNYINLVRININFLNSAGVVAEGCKEVFEWQGKILCADRIGAAGKKGKAAGKGKGQDLF